MVVTVTTTFKSGGDKSPSSHTMLHLCVRPEMIQECQNVHQVLYRRVKFGVARESQECFYVSVCQSCFWAAKFERATSPRRRWNLKVVSILSWQGKVLAQQRSTLSLRRYAAPPQDGEFENAVMEHLPPKGDRLNRSGRNLTCKRILRGCALVCEIWPWSTAGWVLKTPKK